MRAVAAILLLLLNACGTSQGPSTLRDASGVSEPTSCVPYARARSGIQLAGDAYTWWDAAGGRYSRSRAPRIGSVLVINRTSRMRSGHVAVVTRVVNSREIRVDHANWATGAARGRILRDQPVRDVSSGNDWTLVRVWYPPVNDYGNTAVPALGFVHGETVLASR